MMNTHTSVYPNSNFNFFFFLAIVNAYNFTFSFILKTPKFNQLMIKNTSEKVTLQMFILKLKL